MSDVLGSAYIEIVARTQQVPAQVKAGLKEAEKSADEAGKAVGEKFGSRVASTAKVGAVAAGAAVAAGFAANLNLDAANDTFAAQLGLTGPAAAQAGKTAASIYRQNFGDDIGQVREAVRSVVQNIGVQMGAADFKPITAKVLTLSKTFDQDLGGTTRAVGQLIRTGLAKDATDALDIVTVGFQKGVDKSQDFLDTLNEYGTQFRKLGLDGQTATGLLSQGLKGGARDADLVADALKEFSIRAVDGSATTSAGFKSLGLNVDQTVASIAKGGPAAKDSLGVVLERLQAVKDPTDQARIATELFGTQAEDLGKALFALDTKSAVSQLGNVQGAADKVTTSVGSNTQSTIETYRRKLTGMAQDAIQANPALAGVAGAAAAFGPAALSVLGPIAQLITARAASTAAAGAAAAAEVEVGAASTLALGPIGLIVVGVAALAAGLVFAYKHSETFRDIVNGAVNAVKVVFVAAIGVVLGVIDKLLAGYELVARAAGHLPGPLGAPFRAAADAIAGAREKLQGFSAALAEVPTHKFIDIIVRVPSAKELAGVGGSKGLTLEGARAGGGPVRAGRPYLVGEYGPEVIVPAFDGTVIPNQQLGNAGSAGSDRHYHLTAVASEVRLDEQRAMELFGRMELLYG